MDLFRCSPVAKGSWVTSQVILAPAPVEEAEAEAEAEAEEGGSG